MRDSYDVVVVGAGGAGMTAALAAARRGLDTVVIEKSGYFGGSTARSGGGVWIPGNYAVAITDLQTGETVSVNGGRSQLAGCIANLFMLFQVAHDLETGKYAAEHVEWLLTTDTRPSAGADSVRLARSGASEASRDHRGSCPSV